MLIIDRTQRTWATLSAVVCAVAGGVYVWYANWAVNGATGGSVPGLIFGSIAAAMMVFAGLLGARRRFPAARIGSAQFWMKGHLWIGTLTVPFALFHAGFGLGGRVEILLWILFFGVILSGFWGLLLQQLLPRLMFENVSRETFIEQIPHLCNRFTAESDCLLADVCGPLEVSISPVEIKQYAPHWQPYFEEDRKKNRNEYPKTESDAVHFQKFLKKVYASAPISTPVSDNAAEVPPPATTPAVVPAAAPVMKSVAQTKAPEKTPAITSPGATTEGAAPKAKPDLAAMKAAAKAKTADGVDAPAIPESPADGRSPAPASPPAAKPKPDLAAMRAAAKAKATGGDATPPTASSETAPDSGIPTPAAPPAAKPKPDLAAMRAAAKAKAAGGDATPPAATSETAPDSGIPAPAAPPAAKPKPDLAAMRAKAKPVAAAAGSSPIVPAPESSATAEPPATNPLGPLKPVKEPPATAPADLVAAAKGAPPTPAQIQELKLFYLELIRPQLPLQPATESWREAIRRSIMVCQIRSDNQHPDFIPIFDQLLDLCEQRRQFAMIQRYHFWLHGWLLVHIPVTVALYLVLAAHAVSALRVIPFGN